MKMPALVAVLLLVATAASASSGILEVIHVEAAQAEEVSWTQGRGAVLRLARESWDADLTVDFTANASYFRVELDRRTINVTTPVGYSEWDYKEQFLVYEGRGRLVSTSLEYNPGLVVDGRASAVSWDANQLEAELPQNKNGESWYSPATVREHEVIPIDGAFHAKQPDGQIRFSGDFWFTVWGANFTILTPDGAIDVWTGSQSTPYHPLLDLEPYSYGEKTVSQQAFIFIENGTLDVDLDGSESLLYLWNSTSRVLGQATLAGGAIAGSEVHEGPFDMDLFGGDVLSVELRRPSTDEPITPGSATASLPTKSFVLWPAGVVLGLVIGAALLARRRRDWHQAQAAMEVGLYEVAERKTRRFLHSRRRGDEATFLHALCLVHTRGADRAEAFIEARSQMRDLDPAGVHFLMATIRLAQERTRDARSELQACLALRPSFAPEFLQRGELAVLLKGPAGHEGYA